MKKILFSLLAIASSIAVAETATFGGQVITAAGSNWYYEGYKALDINKYDCTTKADFSYTPQDGYKTVKLSKATKENAAKIEKSCTFSNGDDNGKICVIKAEYKPSKQVKGEFDLTKIISVQEQNGKAPCQS